MAWTIYRIFHIDHFADRKSTIFCQIRVRNSEVLWVVLVLQFSIDFAINLNLDEEILFLSRKEIPAHYFPILVFCQSQIHLLWVLRGNPSEVLWVELVFQFSTDFTVNLNPDEDNGFLSRKQIPGHFFHILVFF